MYFGVIGMHLLIAFFMGHFFYASDYNRFNRPLFALLQLLFKKSKSMVLSRLNKVYMKILIKQISFQLVFMFTANCLTAQIVVADSTLNLKLITDSINNVYTDSVQLANAKQTQKHKKAKAIVEDSTIQKKSNWEFNYGLGLNFSFFTETNSIDGTDKKGLSAAGSFDIAVNYKKEGGRFAMTNEFHWLIAMQKSGLNSSAHFQRITDDFKSLHDFSMTVSKKTKWNFNLIAKTSTSIFTIFNGDYFKDLNHLGKIQAFLSPYEITLSPGIKWEPDNYFRISLSPYSMGLYGLVSQQIANTGFYTQTKDANNDYARFVYKQLGAELNIWYDREIKGWVEMQYRLGISSEYLGGFGKNGLMDGLLITKFKLLKNIYLSHRAILKGDLSIAPFRPYFSQTFLLNYTKSF